MPELPEVETIVNDLKKVLPGLKITDVWADLPKLEKIKKQVIGKKILGIERRGKNILIRLSHSRTLLIHLKLTGRLLYGKQKNSQERFIHLIFFLSNGRRLALCDMRKFAKVVVLPTDKISKEFEQLGPEPLDKNFDFKKFKEILKNRRGKIKTVLMNQKVISGIGNIYSDEILWEAGIHPLARTEKLDEKKSKKVFKAIKKILRRAVHQKIQNAYQMTGEKCKEKDGGIIKRIKTNGRSSHFCPVHQKL